MKNYFFDPNVPVNVEVKEHYEYFIDLIDNYLMYEYLYQMQLKFKYFSWKSEIKVEIHVGKSIKTLLSYHNNLVTKINWCQWYYIPTLRVNIILWKLWCKRRK